MAGETRPLRSGVRGGALVALHDPVETTDLALPDALAFGAAADDERSSGDTRTDGCAPMDTNGSDVDVDLTSSALGRSAERQAASFVDADGSNPGAGSVSGSSDSGGDVSMADASDAASDSPSAPARAEISCKIYAEI